MRRIKKALAVAELLNENIRAAVLALDIHATAKDSAGLEDAIRLRPCRDFIGEGVEAVD